MCPVRFFQFFAQQTGLAKQPLKFIVFEQVVVNGVGKQSFEQSAFACLPCSP
jgi:hypothetical protein